MLCLFWGLESDIGALGALMLSAKTSGALGAMVL